MGCTNNVEGRVSIVYGDVTLGLHGETKGKGFSYLFSYAAGGLESLCIEGKEWLYRVPKPTFWRASTDNDKGNRFACHSAMWMGADMFAPCTGIEIYIDGQRKALPTAPDNNCYQGDETAEIVRIEFTYDTATVPSSKVLVSYEVSSTGEIKTSVHYYGRKGLPELPVFGLRFIMPTQAIAYEYEGLSGETYPDRMAGGIPGVYAVEGLPVTPYLVPQDCSIHMGTKWLKVLRNTTLKHTCKSCDQFGLKFYAKDKTFAFSCIPYTALELESATHQEELPLPRRTVLSIMGAVRGVGGMDSWGAEVEPSYRISAEEDIEFEFVIAPL